MSVMGKVLGPLGRGIGGSVVKVHDPHPQATPEMARYTRAAEASASRERAALRSGRGWRFMALVGMGWGALMTYDQRTMSSEMVEIAKYKPVSVVERGADGHQYEAPMKVVGDVSMGTRMQDVLYFVKWFREVGINPVEMDRNRAAARVRLVGEVVKKWDLLVGAHCPPGGDCIVDVTRINVEPGEHDEATRQTSFTATWVETVYDKNYEAKARRAMAMGVVTQDGDPRKGVLDGVGVTGFTEPRAIQELPLSGDGGRGRR